MNSFVSKLLVFSFLLLNSNILIAFENLYSLEELATSYTWRKLLHYESEDNKDFTSAIHSNDFFLSESGKTNPLAEITETIRALQFPQEQFSEDINQHPLCKFPARAQWLHEQLPNLNIINNNVHCKDFKQWSLGEDTESISIVYVTGYLGNPASFYGHTLLKFNSSNNTGKTQLSDISVNYGAIIPDNENPVVYILKGLMGGYDAGFSHINYYFHNHNYGENELRDMWEYELELSPKESQFIVAHAWELLGKKYTYYFLRENCAFQMGELLEIIEGVKVTPTNPVYVIPQALIQELSTNPYKNKSLIREIKFHPSRQTRFYSRFINLSKAEKQSVDFFIQNQGEKGNRDYSQSPIESKHRVLDSALDYYQYLMKVDGEENQQSKKSYNNILSHRFSLAPGETKLSVEKQLAPDNGRKPSYTNIQYIENDNLGSLISVKIRPAYYDQLDGSAGHISHSALSMAEFEIRASEQEVYLHHFDIFSVRSLNNKTTGLPGDSSIAWNIRGGFEQIDSRTTDNLIFKLQGDFGKSYKLSQDSIVVAYLGGAVQQDSQRYGAYYANATIAGHFDLSSSINLLVDIEKRFYPDGLQNKITIKSLQARYETSLNWDTRLYFRDDGNKELGISIGYHW